MRSLAVHLMAPPPLLAAMVHANPARMSWMQHVTRAKWWLRRRLNFMVEASRSGHHAPLLLQCWQLPARWFGGPSAIFPCRVTGGPCPLEVEPAQLAGDINHFTDKVQSWLLSGFQRFG